jgi:oligo-1,6-glucosidase
MTPADFLAEQNRISRDHARAPMPWDGSSNGGFTTGTPWFDLNSNFSEINADAADYNPIYGCYTFLIAVRHTEPCLVYGDYEDLLPEHPHLFAYIRRLDDEGYFIVLNFSPHEQTLVLPGGFRRCEILMCNYKHIEDYDYRAPMRGWEARMYRLSRPA